MEWSACKHAGNQTKRKPGCYIDNKAPARNRRCFFQPAFSAVGTQPSQSFCQWALPSAGGASLRPSFTKTLARGRSHPSPQSFWRHLLIFLRRRVLFESNREAPGSSKPWRTRSPSPSAPGRLRRRRTPPLPPWGRRRTRAPRWPPSCGSRRSPSPPARRTRMYSSTCEMPHFRLLRSLVRAIALASARLGADLG
jgi:hypothetical protein